MLSEAFQWLITLHWFHFSTVVVSNRKQQQHWQITKMKNIHENVIRRLCVVVCLSGILWLLGDESFGFAFTSALQIVPHPCWCKVHVQRDDSEKWTTVYQVCRARSQVTSTLHCFHKGYCSLVLEKCVVFELSQDDNWGTSLCAMTSPFYGRVGSICGI